VHEWPNTAEFLFELGCYVGRDSCGMAAKRISQATFHGVVVENMTEFDMSKEEAIADAVEQFKAQGVDLSDIDTACAAIREDGTIEVGVEVTRL
jgi:hypothetical protein